MKKQNGAAEKKGTLTESLGIADERGNQLISDTVDTVQSWLDSDENLSTGDLFKMVAEKAKPVTAVEGMLCGFSIEKTLSLKTSPFSKLEMMFRS